MIAQASLYERLQNEKEVFVAPAFTYLDFRSQYDWMRVQMAKRIPGYQGHYPWWAWQQYQPGKPKPDLRIRDLHCFDRGTPAVRLELDVPDHEVLLSDFIMWNHVLNNGYMAYSETEYDAWDELPPDQRIQERLETS